MADLQIGDRVRIVVGKHEGFEGQIMDMSPLVSGRQVIFILSDTGRRLAAMPKQLEKIRRLTH